jgi:hypothetical protein
MDNRLDNTLNILDSLNLLNSIENINYYPFNLNDNLQDNIIETKNEIELEYKKDFKKIVNISSNNIKKEGGYESFIYIY